MTSWRDELPADLAREQMVDEAVRRGTARRRRRQRRRAAMGGGLGLMITFMIAVVALPSSSDTSGTGEDGVRVVGPAGVDSSAGSTQLSEPVQPGGETTTTAPQPPVFLPSTTVAPPVGDKPPATEAPRQPAGPTATVAAPPRPAQDTSTTTSSTAPTVAGDPGPPEFVSATGNAVTRRVMVRFTRPVVPGTANLALVHQAGDSTCSTPNGNANEYLAGSGTDTITVGVTNLVVGTTFISIGAGFVKNATDGMQNVAMPCVGIPVKG